MSTVAVIGSGIAGISAAYALDRAGVAVTLFEAEQQLGGHTHTHVVAGGARDGSDLPVDMGFIVHNTRTYPNLIGFLSDLGVEVRDTEMSFSVQCAGCGLEYAGRAPWAQLPGILRPRTLRIFREILRFQRDARRLLDGGIARYEGMTLAEFVAERGYSTCFTAHYLVPLTAAIWSTAPRGVLDFPMGYALRFFDNHGLLRLRGLQWRTIVGGSSTYIDAMLARFSGTVRVGVPIREVRRVAGGVRVTLPDGAVESFDHVVIATHPDQALQLLADASPREQAALATFEYTTSEVVLHTDERLLPRRAGARASWNYQLPACSLDDERPTMTYYMNRLQGLDSDVHYSVTLNRGADIDEASIISTRSFAHPRFTHQTLRAQQKVHAMQGEAGTWFAGAWLGDGFHEAGFTSGLRAAEAILRDRQRGESPPPVAEPVPAIRSAIYRGHVVHARSEVARNVFRYPTCFYRIDLDELPQLSTKLRTFAHNSSRSLVSLSNDEYLGGSADEPLKTTIVRWLGEQGVPARDPDAWRIELVTNLRVLGYVFNPISCMYVYDASSGELRWMIAEVHNTFGEQHRYLLELDEGSVATGRAMQSMHAKELHVSPFMPMDRTYRFRVRRPGATYSLGIDVLGGERPFTTAWTGVELPLTDANVIRTLVRYPIAPLLVSVRIHVQAARLWLKRVPVFRKPPRPSQGVQQ